MTISRETLEKLAAVDTPTISNVIELFDLRPRHVGYMDGRIRAYFPEMPPMVGFACTAAFRSAEPPTGSDIYGSLDRQLEQLAELPGPGVVVFQDLDDPPVGATFGEVMCSAYRAFGSVGLITSGAGRDLEQVRPLGYPVFTGGTICSHGWSHLLHLGQPVRVGGLMVHQGDLLHGDANGVTSIPLAIAAAVADAAPEFIAAERIVIDYAQSPGPKTRESFAAARKEYHAARERLRSRLQT